MVVKLSEGQALNDFVVRQLKVLAAQIEDGLWDVVSWDRHDHLHGNMEMTIELQDALPNASPRTQEP